MRYDPVNEIIITVGVSEALYLTMTALLDPGDEVIIPTPCFVSYQAEVILAGGVPVEIPSKLEDDFQLDPDRIRAAITPRTKVIFIGYPSNPTGAVAERETLLEMAKIAEEHDLMLVSDEIYDRLVYDFEHVCFPALGESIKQRTILLGGFSKSLRHDRLAHRLCRRPGRHHQGAGAHPPVHHHVRADHRPGRRAGRHCTAANPTWRRWWPSTTAAGA